jgi:hypothetical protein
MKKWEIDRVNDLYTQIDELNEENTRLKHGVEMSKYGKSLDELTTSVNDMCARLSTLEQLIDKSTKRVIKK